LFVSTANRIRLGKERIDIFYNAIKADVYFLKDLNIMDYSLLLGIHQAGKRPALMRRRSSGVVLSSVRR
jgi:hypothetical protein